MVDKSGLSKKLLEHSEAKNEAALERVILAKKRVQSILDRDIVAHRKTLEQKIGDQGPKEQRVDPHLVGLAIMDLQEQNRLLDHTHAGSGSVPWHSNLLTDPAKVAKKLDEIAPLYKKVSGGSFGNLTGDALEIPVWKCLRDIYEGNKRYAYLGHFKLDASKDQYGRYPKIQPPKTLGAGSTIKEADFIQYGHDCGPLCIECKNYREWIYPSDGKIKELIIKAYELETVPVMIARRIHYTTLTNFLVPAGIIAHESYFQYYPVAHSDLADQVKHARKLGFTDVRATEDPDPRTVRFFNELLPKIAVPMGEKWATYRDDLYDYAKGKIHLAQLYTIIGSPAGGKWIDKPTDDEADPYEDYNPYEDDDPFS